MTVTQQWSREFLNLDTPEIKALVRKKYRLEINETDWNGMCILFYATAYHEIDLIRFLVEEMNANVDVSSNDFPTALYYAVLMGYEEKAKYLLEKGADPNIPHLGRTVLYQAVQDEHIGFCRLLTDHGADLRMPPVETVLDRAIRVGNEQIIFYLLEVEAKRLAEQQMVVICAPNRKSPVSHMAVELKRTLFTYLS